MYKKYIREVSDFPIDGISFKDISPLLADDVKFNNLIGDMYFLLEGAPLQIPDYWVGVDARGFLFASALSVRFGGGVLLCRKQGKLPPPTIKYEYKTEYSEDVLEIKQGKGSVVVVDDVLATGGTLNAVNELCKLAGYEIQDNIVVMDLQYVPRVKNFNLDVRSVIQYESDAIR
tara:strand:+ start:234 stop:755 length:522 start_codon:yes stop_codon:yes gene_type:complete